MTIRTLRSLALASLGCTLAGCTVGPNFVKPKPNVPAHWSSTAMGNGTEGAAHVTSGPAQTTAWWSSFDDPTLTSLVEQSASQNLNLKQAVLRIEEAQAQEAVVAGGFWPSLSANTSWSRQRVSTNTPNGFIFGAHFPGLPATLTNPFDLYQLGLGASWTLDLFGTARRAIEAANAEMQSAVQGEHAAVLSMVSDVAATYIDLRGAQARRAILERSLATQRDLLRLTRDRHNAGLTSDLDVQNALAEVGTTQAQVPLADRQITVDINQLSELMAKPPEALRTELAAARPVPPVPPVVPIGLPSTLARRRPDIRQAEANLHAVTAEIGVAVSNFFPRLTLTASGGYQSQGLSQLIAAASRFATLGPAIELPIFEGGRLRATVRLRRLQAKEAAVIYAQTVLTALNQVEDGLAAYGSDQARRASLETAVKASRNARLLARQRYESGVASFIVVLDAERTEEQNELALAEATTAVSADLVQLYRALGGGWQNGNSDRSSPRHLTGETPWPASPSTSSASIAPAAAR
ncbi:MAG: efflux transporter outer membrane subunit [Steroidobacteraceae bacterium]